MREKIEYFIVVFIVKLGKILPVKFLYFLLDKIAILLFLTLKSRRNLTIQNLQNALNLSQNDAKILAKKCFQSIARAACESILIFNDRFDFDKMINRKNFIKKNFAKIAKNNGVIILTAHFGNWEALSHYAAILGYPQLVIGREGNNQAIETRITRPSREKFGNILAYKNEAMAKMVKQLKNGGIVGLLPDLNSGDNVNSVQINFFGRSCWATKAIALLVLKYKIPVFGTFFRRTKNGTYEPIIEEINFQLTGEKNSDIKTITQTCNDTIERVIRTAPEQWFWVHNRWRQ